MYLLYIMYMPIQKLAVNDEEILYLGECQNKEATYVVFISLEVQDMPTIDFVSKTYATTEETNKNVTYQELIELFVTAYNFEKLYNPKSLAFQKALETAENSILLHVIHMLQTMSYVEQEQHVCQLIANGLDFDNIKQLYEEIINIVQTPHVEIF